MHNSVKPTPADVDPPPLRLDMDAIARAATPAMKRYHLEFESDGALYVWHGQAIGDAAAAIRARRELADTEPAFRQLHARLISCAYGVAIWPCACVGYGS